MEKPRDKIYGRERVAVDNRTSGIRAAAHTTGAMGDQTRSAPVVHIPADQSRARAWANLSSSLGDLIRGVTTQMNRQEAEEERARNKAEREAEKAEMRAERDRLRAEAKAEKEMEMLEVIKADRWALDLHRDLSEARNRGELQNMEQLHDRISQATAGLDQSDSLAFKAHAGQRIYPLLLKFQDEIDTQHQQDFTALAQGEITDGLATVYRSFDLGTDEGRLRMDETRQKGRELFMARGGTESGYNRLLLDAARQAARNEAHRDPSKMHEILEEAERIPGGLQFVESLRAELDKEVIERERTQDIRNRENELRTWEFNEASMVAKAASLSPEELTAWIARLQADPSAVLSLVGNRVDSFYSKLNALSEYHTRADGREEQEKIKASALAVSEYEKRLTLGERITQGELLDDERVHPLHMPDLLRSYRSEETRRYQALEPLVAAAAEGFVRRLPTEATFIYPRDARGTPLVSDEDLNALKGLFVESAMQIKRSEFPEGAEGETSFRRAQIQQLERAVTETLKTGVGVRWSTPSGEAKAVSPKPEVATASDLESDPVALEAFKKRLTGGSDWIKADRTGSGRPLSARVDSTFYRSLEDPKKIRIANYLLRVDALERYLEETDPWYDSSPETKWRQQYTGTFLRYIFGAPTEVNRARGFFNQYDDGKMTIYSHPDMVPFELEPLELREVPETTE